MLSSGLQMTSELRIRVLKADVTFDELENRAWRNHQLTVWTKMALYKSMAVRENLLLMASCRERCPPLVGTVTSTPLAAGTSCPSCPPTTNDSAKALVTPAGSDTSRRLMSASRFRIPLASKFCDPFHLAQTALHLVQMFFGYMLMLTAMTYNVYMLIAVMLGFTVGYFLFSRQRPLLLRSPTCCH
ncbi:unnamed protein product [Dicrocoelium dendriticum]|nr:unnamed protein product [Dicrocoelium dendriticum]CAH8566612.1 unnamed protein product [Dicrocoelium dendriticum]